MVDKMQHKPDESKDEFDSEDDFDSEEAPIIKEKRVFQIIENVDSFDEDD
jgi:hypothetical protein